MNDLDRLRNIRAGNRAVVTRLQRETENRLESEEEITDTVVLRLRTIIKTLKEKHELLKDLDSQILSKIEPGEIAEEIEQSSELLCNLDESILKLEDALQKNTDKKTETSVGSIRERLQSQSLSSRAPSPTASENGEPNERLRFGGVQAKLPKLPLPRFSGEILKFQTFWESFESMVDKNKTLTSIDKFNYLQRSLEGTAARAIEGLPLRERTYDSAIKLLKERFGNKQKVISAHMEELLKLKPCDSKSDITELRTIYDKINIQIRGLEASGVTSEAYGSLLVPLIMAHLPKDISLQIARQTTKEVWSLTELMELLRKEVEVRELDLDVAKNQIRKAQTQNATPTASALHTQATPTSQQANCIFCKGKHRSWQCQVVTEIDKKMDILSKERRCFRCFGTGHRASNCRKLGKCSRCKGSHNTVICRKDRNTEKLESTKKDAVDEPQVQTNGMTTHTKMERRNILLQTARTYASKSDTAQKVPVRILFDSGSQLNYVTNNIQSKLNLEPIGQDVININTFGSDKFRKQKCDLVKINVETSDNNFITIVAYSSPVICTPVKSTVDLDMFPHLARLNLADNPENVVNASESIDILVGLENYYDFVLGEVVKEDRGPIAVNSKLGWLISGPSGKDSDDTGHNLCVTSNLVIEGNEFSRNNDSAELVETFKQVFEVVDDKSNVVPTSESKKLEFIEACSINFNGVRYEIGLPWSTQISKPLNSNYSLSLKRLNSLYVRLQEDPGLLEKYDANFQEQLLSGVIERVEEPRDGVKTGFHFLAHHGVYRESRETSKLRVVFDASAKSSPETLSLNEHLQTGPNFVPMLFDKIIDFRSNCIALTADIEKAFLQIGIRESDRDYLRFLWFDNVKGDNPSVVQYRFCRLPFGLKCSPAILGSVLYKHAMSFAGKYPEVSKVVSNCYVDDLTCNTNSIESGLHIYEAAKEITDSAGFNLRKWSSNSKELLSRIEQSEKERANIINANESFADEGKTSSHEKVAVNTKTKVLGVQWDTESDRLIFGTKETAEYAKSLPITKRSLLKISAKIFDPMGVLGPLVIKLKSLFQQLCLQGIAWDDELDGELSLKYNKLMFELQEFTDISIPRYYLCGDKQVKDIQLHGFSDASEMAYASVVYIRVEYVDGDVEVKFISSKDRVSPIKGQTIPRLELMGACLLAKHMQNIQEVLRIPGYEGLIKSFLFTDSSTVLCWIRNVKPWKQFVRTRVEQILRVSERKQWRYCPGNLNAADFPSRGTRGRTLSFSRAWLEGPPFLQLAYEEWPDDLSTGNVDNFLADQEIVRIPLKPTFALANNIVEDNKLNEFIDVERFSNKQRLLRTVAWIYRFVNNSRSKDKVTSELSSLELQKAENFVLRKIQAEAFEESLNYLSESDKSRRGRPPLLVAQFRLFVDSDGLLKAKSRNKNAFLEEESKVPILLPSKHWYSYLVVVDCHEKVFHNGIRDTLTRSREKYWILRGRETVKKYVRHCKICKKFEGLPYKPVSCKDLPPSRVDDGPPFINTGIDFAGPLYVQDRNSLDNETRKVYICLFTCASTRAVHLELVDRLDAQSFLRAFRRFSARRGLPRTLLSDNAQTFKTASKDVKRIILSSEVQGHLADRSVSWHFSVQLAAWYGGIWERMVRSVKRCLRKVIGRASLGRDELSTLLVEIESVVNSRPLTYVYDDKEGVSYPLTPAQLIYGYSVTRSPNGRHFEVISTNESLTRRVNYHRRLLQQFAKRWKHEYLISMREIKSVVDSGKDPTVAIGDIVVVMNEQTKRMFWKLGKIEELIVGRDGHVRAAKIRVTNQFGTSLLTRSLKHLVPLEVSSKDDAKNSIVSKAVETNVVSDNDSCTTSNVRPRRNAAVIGELKRKDQSLM